MHGRPTDTLINVGTNAGNRAADESGHEAGDHKDLEPRFGEGGRVVTLAPSTVAGGTPTSEKEL
jgi:hypothetical protein